MIVDNISIAIAMMACPSLMLFSNVGFGLIFIDMHWLFLLILGQMHIYFINGIVLVMANDA